MILSSEQRFYRIVANPDDNASSLTLEEADAHRDEIGRVKDEIWSSSLILLKLNTVVVFFTLRLVLNLSQAFLSFGRLWHLESLSPHLREVIIARVERVEVGGNEEVGGGLEENDVCGDHTAYLGVEADDVTHDQFFGVDEVLFAVAQGVGHRNWHERKSVVQVDLAVGGGLTWSS